MPTVYADRHRHTCIELTRTSKVVFIQLDQDGVSLRELPIGKFDDIYNVKMPDYPIDKAARNYIKFARNLGASNEAISELAKLIPEDISKEIQMITEKKENADRIKAAKEASKKKTDEQKPLTTKERELAKKAFFGDKKAAEQLAKPAKSTKVAKPVKTMKPAAKSTKSDAPKEKRHTASQMFQELILEGKLTDDKIFAKVQEEFGLDDKKRGYVKWYRNNLIKQGVKKVPAAK